jgi:deoxyribodipyrimidine photo-lyase
VKEVLNASEIDEEYEKADRVRIIMWFRNDCRLHDNEVLHQALEKSKQHKYKIFIEIVPVFVFDPRLYEAKNEEFDSRKIGIRRALFNLETIDSFRQRFRSINSELLVYYGKAEEIIP